MRFMICNPKRVCFLMREDDSTSTAIGDLLYSTIDGQYVVRPDGYPKDIRVKDVEFLEDLN